MTGRILLLGLLLAFGAASGAPAQAPDTAVEPRGLSLTLDTGSDRFHRGEAVPLKLTASNLLTHSITVPFRTTQHFEFQVLRDGKLVWNLGYHKRFSRSIVPLIVAAGEKVTFTAAWDQLGNDGKQVSPGTYTVRAFLPSTAGRDLLAIQSRVDILNP